MKFKTGDKHLIREINKSLILKIIRENGPLSRADIAKILGLNPATVSSNIKILLNDGLIKEHGIGESSGGRKPIMLTINKASFNCIGVNVQKDRVITAAVNLEGQLISRVEVDFEGVVSQENIINAIFDSIHRAKENSGIDEDSYFGMGVGMHGIVNYKQGVSVHAPAFSWYNIDIKGLLEEHFHIPVVVDNDVRVMALAEKWFGIAQDVENFVFVNVGSGIGSGIMINGELYRGAGFAAGEVGHIRAVENGSKCVCGKFGCLDTVATEKSLVKTVASSIQIGYKTCIADLVSNDLQKIDTGIIYQAAMRGDELAVNSLAQVGRYLGVAVADIVNILNPEMVIIGGSVSLAEDFLFKPLIDTANMLSMDDCIKDVQIVPSLLKENCGVLGAATMAIQSVFNGPKVK